MIFEKLVLGEEQRVQLSFTLKKHLYDLNTIRLFNQNFCIQSILPLKCYRPIFFRFLADFELKTIKLKTKVHFMIMQ